MKILFPLIFLIPLLASCSDRADSTSPEAVRKAKVEQFKAMRQEITDRYENGRAFYLETVEKKLREQYPVGSGHEEEISKAKADALRYYERMLQGELNQLEQSSGLGPSGKLEIIRKPDSGPPAP